jgi:hypothetical protein
MWQEKPQPQIQTQSRTKTNNYDTENLEPLDEATAETLIFNLTNQQTSEFLRWMDTIDPQLLNKVELTTDGTKTRSNKVAPPLPDYT